MYTYIASFNCIWSYLVGKLADVLFDVPGAFKYFRESTRGHCNAGKNGTSHLSICIIFENQHVR